MVWELMSRKVPFADLAAAAIAPSVVKGCRPPIDGTWDKTIVELLKKCWAPLPEQRYSIKDAR